MSNYSRIRITAAAAAVIGALTITACGGSGDSVVDKPKAKASAKADSGQQAKKKAAEKEAAPEVAKTGDTLALKGMEDGSKLDVTVVKVVDNAKSGDEFTAPESGNRWIAVQFQLVNTGTKAYTDSPQNGAQVADDQGQQFQTTFAEVTAGPSMSSAVRLKPGAKALGWIVFEVPKASKVATVQFAMDSGFAEQTGEWQLT
ncbi:DUF4352 domain-containing protein [Streptomyces lomondensis]|nr:DUF4352 domain-containing protein [Streptomyces lomondensis]MCF0078058.1 DUF4352 domain-containing protein [Streptomyces lomondensis]